MSGFSMKAKQDAIEPEDHPESNLVAIIDLDYVKYSTASVAEEVTIKVTHKASGNEKEFKNITEFRGRGKKIGGWLGDLNEERKDKKPFTLDDFEVEQIQRRKKVQTKEFLEYEALPQAKKKNIEIPEEFYTDEETLGHILHSTKQMILKDLKALGTDKYEGFMGKGDSFRVGVSTLQKYKGNRDKTLRPLIIDDITEYLKNRFSATVVMGLEADDEVVIRAHGDENAVIVGEDKDYRGQPVKFFDINNPDEGIINGDCFGKLWITGTGTKEKIRGYGRLFMYWQMISEDKVDNYKANCHSDTKWAGKGAYKVLCECKDDKEALEVCITTMQKLYPIPKVINTWQGHETLIDWLYVLREMFQMARMKTHHNDFTVLDDWFVKYDVEYSYFKQ